MSIRQIILPLAAVIILAAPAMAQEAYDPGHPRVNEVDQRLNNQQQRIGNGVGTGQIGSPYRAGADEARSARISNEAARDEAAHGGHLTRHETRHINRQLNRNSRHIYRQRHNQ